MARYQGLVACHGQFVMAMESGQQKKMKADDVLKMGEQILEDQRITHDEKVFQPDARPRNILNSPFVRSFYKDLVRLFSWTGE